MTPFFAFSSTSEHVCEVTNTETEYLVEKCGMFNYLVINEGYTLDKERSGVDHWDPFSLLSNITMWGQDVNSSPNCTFKR